MCMHVRIHLLAPLKAKLTIFCGEKRHKRQVTQLPCWQEGVKAQCCPSRRVLGYSSPALQYHLATAPRDMSCWFWAQPILTHPTWASQEVTERSTGQWPLNNCTSCMQLFRSPLPLEEARHNRQGYRMVKGLSMLALLWGPFLYIPPRQYTISTQEKNVVLEELMMESY